MILDAIRNLPESDIRQLEPNRVAGYLRATGWQPGPVSRQKTTIILERPENDMIQVRIPTSRELLDFNLLMAQTIAVVAEFERRLPGDVLSELLRPAADVLSIREDGAVGISLERLQAIVPGACNLLLTAAQSVSASLEAEETNWSAEWYLGQCRVLRPEGDGVLLRVACPLVADTKGTPTKVPVGRRVVRNLMRMLLHIADNCESQANQPPDAEWDEATQDNLREAIVGMLPGNGATELEVTAIWSWEQPGGGNPTQVRLSREALVSNRPPAVATR